MVDITESANIENENAIEIVSGIVDVLIVEGNSYLPRIFIYFTNPVTVFQNKTKNTRKMCSKHANF